MIMKCRPKDEYEVIALTKSTAQYALEKMGYGVERCKETYSKDKRFGIVTKSGIEFGFKGSMEAKWWFGWYLVNDDHCDGWYPYQSKKEFEEYYEII